MIETMAENKLLRSRVEELERELEESADNQCSYHSKVVELEGEIARLHAELDERDKTIMNLSPRDIDEDIWEENEKKDEEIHDLKAEIARLREMVRWRNYPEEKPNKPGDYWCEIASAVDVGKIYEDALNYNDGWGTYARVSRWTFLPQPPEVK